MIQENKYTYRFNVKCPNDNKIICYKVKIKTNELIFVEDIVKKCKSIETGFQEDIANQLMMEFGGVQTITAVHNGVSVRTFRNENNA